VLTSPEKELQYSKGPPNVTSGGQLPRGEKEKRDEAQSSRKEMLPQQERPPSYANTRGKKKKVLGNTKKNLLFHSGRMRGRRNREGRTSASSIFTTKIFFFWGKGKRREPRRKKKVDGSDAFQTVREAKFNLSPSRKKMRAKKITRQDRKGGEGSFFWQPLSQERRQGLGHLVR